MIADASVGAVPSAFPNLSTNFCTKSTCVWSGPPKAFEYYGLRPAAEVLRRAAREVADEDGGTLEAAFREHLRQRPDAYAPLDDIDVD